VPIGSQGPLIIAHRLLLPRRLSICHQPMSHWYILVDSGSLQREPVHSLSGRPVLRGKPRWLWTNLSIGPLCCGFALNQSLNTLMSNAGYICFGSAEFSSPDSPTITWGRRCPPGLIVLCASSSLICFQEHIAPRALDQPPRVHKAHILAQMDLFPLTNAPRALLDTTVPSKG
jgi:hypothetical protein